jgi:hypothetical protein
VGAGECDPQGLRMSVKSQVSRILRGALRDPGMLETCSLCKYLNCKTKHSPCTTFQFPVMVFSALACGIMSSVFYDAKQLLCMFHVFSHGFAYSKYFLVSRSDFKTLKFAA